MVTTRAKQPTVAAQAVTLLHAASEDAAESPETPSPGTVTEGEPGTIGARLRKRRRTQSPSAETDPSSRKRRSLQKPILNDDARVPSPDHKRKISTIDKRILSTSKDEIFESKRSKSGHKGARALSVKLDPTLDDQEQQFDNVSRSSEATQDADDFPEQDERSSMPFQAADVKLLSVDEAAHIQSQQQSRNGLAQPQPEMVQQLMHIVKRGEHIDSLRGPDDSYDVIHLDSIPDFGSSLQLKTQSLPILDNLATQILNALGKSSYQEILSIVKEPDSDVGRQYISLMSLFDHTRKVYSIEEKFLRISDIGLSDQGAIDTMRKANLATFVSSVYGSQEIGFHHLNEYFLDAFVTEGGRLLKSQAGLFLDLKTQAYISAMSIGDQPREQIIEDLFPTNLEQVLLSRRPGAKSLAPSEADFLQRARNRRKLLLDEPDTEAAIEALPEKYFWEDFLRDVSAYVSKNFEMLVGVPAAAKIGRSSRASDGVDVDQQLEHSEQQHQTQNLQMRTQQPPVTQHPPSDQMSPQQHSNGDQPGTTDGNASQIPGDSDDIAGKAAQAAHFAMQGYTMPDSHTQSPPHQQPFQNGHPAMHQQNPQHHQPAHPAQFLPHPPHPAFAEHYQFRPHPGQPIDPRAPPGFPPPPAGFQYQFHQQHPGLQHQPPPGYYHPQQQMNGHPQQDSNQQQSIFADTNGIPYPTQTAPTQVLYERARQAATAKSTPSNRRAGTPSQRRPWTTEEENALMAGLDRVKGPHWSQILAMFGPGGTINESLKDRNQVQLKDKARNLKLFFLKSGIEVPYYLQFVTGELKTRAPAQAAKNEEGRRTSLGTSEDKGHVEAVMALASGMTPNSVPYSAASATQIPATTITRDLEANNMSAAANDDQTPILSVGERPANSAPATREQFRRDSTISANGIRSTAPVSADTLVADRARVTPVHVDNSTTDAANEAAAEAARAIALMGQI